MAKPAHTTIPQFSEPPPHHVWPDVHQMWALYEGFRLVADLMEGLLCQPRYQQLDRHLLSSAGERLDDIREQMHRSADEIAERARALTPKTVADKKYRDRIIMADAVRNFETSAQVAAVAADLIWQPTH